MLLGVSGDIKMYLLNHTDKLNMLPLRVKQAGKKMGKCVCVCERERECVCERERERECACVCV